MASWDTLAEALTIGWGIERAFVCPAHPSDNAHASVNAITGWWYCYSCHSSGRVDLDRIETDPHAVRRLVEQTLDTLDRPHPTYPETYLNLYDATGPGSYWLSRFGPEILAAHRFGQDPTGTFAVIPMRDNLGRVLGVIRRDLTGVDKVKYRYPSGLRISDYLYNYARCTQGTILLTEGATDAVAAEEAGFTAMACYGSNLSRTQATLLCKYAPDRVLVAFDQDNAGHSGFERVLGRIGSDLRVERVWWDTYKDLASMPVELRAQMLDQVCAPVA